MRTSHGDAMTGPVRAFARALDSSVVARGARRIAANSAVCTAAAAAIQRLSRGRERIGVSLASVRSDEHEVRAAEQLSATLAANSRLVTALWSLITVPSTAWREARVRHLVAPIVSVDLQVRVRVAGIAVMAAVLTHTMLLALVGVPVQTVGWGMRISLMVAGAFAAFRPRALGLAWRDWAGRKTGSPKLVTEPIGPAKRGAREQHVSD